MNGTECNRELFNKQEMFKLTGAMNYRNGIKANYYGNGMCESTEFDKPFLTNTDFSTIFENRYIKVPIKKHFCCLLGGKSMKIVSWNCHYGFFGEKTEIIKNYKADILVIPECREMDMEGCGYDEKHRDWYGDHYEATMENGKIDPQKDLGIGVFWKDDITINRLPEWKKSLSKESDFRYMVPYIVYGNFSPFTLITVWTKNKGIVDKNDRLDYVLKAHAAIDHYKDIGLLNGRVMLIGDFNSDTVWDGNYPKDKNHSALVDKLESWNIHNCSAKPEEEKNSTYYYYTKNGEKQVVDDHCFVSEGIANKPTFSVPGANEWIPDSNGKKLWKGLSDHCPISVEFSLT